MCKGAMEKRNGSIATQQRPSLRLLLSLESFSSDGEKGGAQEPPGLLSFFLTGVIVVSFLIGMEMTFRHLFQQIRHWHPLLENETNRQILSRHIGVDALSCAIVAWLGWQARHIQWCLYQAALSSSKAKRSESKDGKSSPDCPFMPAAGHEQRMYTYHPAGFRIALFFFFYQVKNLYDTIVWHDGPEFIFHHVFSMITAWGAMYPGCGHFYTLFFFGISEVSTAVLCVLANFDERHGVPGLGEAFPMVKVGLGALFVVLFIVFRCILWPLVSYYFARDVLLALKGHDERTIRRKNWFKFFLVSLTGLSALQVAWLGQIFLIAKEELIKVGLV
jgi:hypothetical protein